MTAGADNKIFFLFFSNNGRAKGTCHTAEINKPNYVEVERNRVGFTVALPVKHFSLM